MRIGLAMMISFFGGFGIMVLEIVGARFLAADFGASFYVWVSQIGVILGALALGYLAGGWLADRFQRSSLLAILLVPAGVFTFCIPQFARKLTEAIVLRHPKQEPIPPLWEKLDPVIGSSLIFLLPCVALAMVSPYMVRVASRRLAQVGRVSGLIYSSGTVGSIAGVFVSGYVLIDQLSLSAIFRSVGVGMSLLGMVAVFVDRWLIAVGSGEM